jgi:hypothetical protein
MARRRLRARLGSGPTAGRTANPTLDATESRGAGGGADGGAGRGARLPGRVAARLAALLRGAGRTHARRPAEAPAPVAGPAPDIEYRPRDDGHPDPGEVVWAWVPYEEDDGRGKDRPVLVIGRRGRDLLALMLTSKDHDRDAADEARHGRFWTDIGRGPWDVHGRASEVRLDRLLVLSPSAVRREGAALDRHRFDVVVAEAARVQGW